MIFYDNVDDITLNVLEKEQYINIRIHNKEYKLEHILCNSNNVTNTLIDIGKFRYNNWKDVINQDLSIDDKYGQSIWLDELDFIINSSRNFIIKDTNNNEIIAVARLTYHETFEDDRSRDLVIFKEYNNNDIKSSVIDFGRLIVKKEEYGNGIAQFLNRLRISLANKLGAKYIIVTASYDNMIRLKTLGFEEIGKIVYFDDRPNVAFHCLQYRLSD